MCQLMYCRNPCTITFLMPYLISYIFYQYFCHIVKIKLLSVTNTYTVGDSNPLMTIWYIPLTIVSHTKFECGLTKQAMSPIVSSILLFLGFFPILLF